MLEGARRPTLHQLTLTCVPFAVAFAFSIFDAISKPEVDFSRTLYLIRSSLVLTTPALILYVLAFRRTVLSNYWRLFWTFGCLTYLAHFYYGYVILFQGNFTAVRESQGSIVATSNLMVTILWPIDVIFSWATRNRPVWLLWYRFITHTLVFVSFFMSSVIFKRGVVQWLGIGMVILVITAVALRIGGVPAATGSESAVEAS